MTHTRAKYGAHDVNTYDVNPKPATTNTNASARYPNVAIDRPDPFFP